MNKEYIIVELIPNKSKDGIIVQLDALKINKNKIVDRFHYRVIDKLVENKDLLSLISYDKEGYCYVENPNNILKDFKVFIEDLDLLIIDNEYTKHYLKSIKNKKESVFKYLNLNYSEDVMDKVIKKYKLLESNYIVDLLYEALMFEYY